MYDEKAAAEKYFNEAGEYADHLRAEALRKKYKAPEAPAQDQASDAPADEIDPAVLEQMLGE